MHNYQTKKVDPVVGVCQLLFEKIEAFNAAVNRAFKGVHKRRKPKLGAFADGIPNRFVPLITEGMFERIISSVIYLW